MSLKCPRTCPLLRHFRRAFFFRAPTPCLPVVHHLIQGVGIVCVLIEMRSYQSIGRLEGNVKMQAARTPWALGRGPAWGMGGRAPGCESGHCRRSVEWSGIDRRFVWRATVMACPAGGLKANEGSRGRALWRWQAALTGACTRRSRPGPARRCRSSGAPCRSGGNGSSNSRDSARAGSGCRN